MKQSFNAAKEPVSEQTAIQGMFVISWQDKSWTRTTLLNDRAVQLSTASLHVLRFSIVRGKNVQHSRQRMEGEN